MEQDNDRTDEPQQPRWYQTRWGRGLAVVGGIAAAAALWALLRWYLLPDEPSPSERKDLVLAWAAIVAGVGGVGTLYVGWRNMRTTQDNLRIAQENTEKTLLNTRQVEEERAREQALQSYLEHIGKLLTEEELRPSQTEQGNDAQIADGARIVARAQTLAVLQGLDPKRKRILLQFLYEAGLISRDQTVVSLAGADLEGADLTKANLRRANLEEADLTNADLTEADLEEAILSGANLERAILKEARLVRTNLRGAYLALAKSTKATFREATLEGANLTSAGLAGATLREADLKEADLTGADLAGGYLMRAVNLTQAQVEAALGDQKTELPPGLHSPKAWLDKPDGQPAEQD